ncbi:MAG: bifunctional folylpolyglutamate synthase/dihydrofolate synthase [Bacteroidales bacterium]|nr:bifunctional folylpolyglutamate synthase/dihydrofolate synthase [Bacteroidales bacterium]
MNYQQATEFLFSQLPVFHRQGAAAYKADLTSTLRIMEAVGNPQNTFQSVHVAGTNGKGSSSHMLASILYEHKMKTGLHTSPHLKDLRERIVVNSRMCSKNYVISFLKKYRQPIQQIQPSFFELMVAMAFSYFKKNADIAVVETGMGGRLDSTNILLPLVSLITNISFDHTQFLGSTLKEIAGEKAGIIKANTPVVISQTQPECAEVFINKARQMNAPIYFADSIYSIHSDTLTAEGYRVMDIYRKGEPFITNLKCPLCGEYQKKNILGVLQTVEVLNRHCNLNITKAETANGIANLQSSFPLLGRWQTLCLNPLTICDTGHNEDGLKQVLSQLNAVKTKPLHFVFGVVNDKEVEKEIQMLPQDAVYYLCKADIPRGLDVNILASMFKAHNIKHKIFPSVKDALKNAQKDALISKGMVFVGGSTYTVAEIV